jgi:hypothetical protein
MLAPFRFYYILTQVLSTSIGSVICSQLSDHLDCILQITVETKIMFKYYPTKHFTKHIDFRMTLKPRLYPLNKDLGCKTF